MSLLARDELKALAEAQSDQCVSIYMPTLRAGADVLQNALRLKNQLGQIESQLQTMGLRTPKIKTYLAPLVDLLEDRLFWQYQYDGLAIFLSPDDLYIYRLPLEFEALALVAERFHLKPLLPLLSANEQFYLLTLDQEEIHLFLGTHFSIREVELRDIPAGLSEFLMDVERERHLQFHTSTRVPGGRGGERHASFHGHAVVKSNENIDILRYFQRIDAGFNTIWEGESVPLILAGVDNLVSIYRQANSYPHLLEEYIMSHPTALSVEALHARAWAIVQPHFLTAQQEADALYKHLAGSGDARASSDLARIVADAYYERVDTLFAAADIQQWGTFDPQAHEASVHTERESADQDLLDLAVVHTFLNRGTVFVLPAEEIPAPGPVAAILRY